MHKNTRSESLSQPTQREKLRRVTKQLLLLLPWIAIQGKTLGPCAFDHT